MKIKHVKVPEWAISQIVDYLYEDEERHYRELGEPRKHIFQAVLQLDRALIDKK